MESDFLQKTLLIYGFNFFKYILIAGGLFLFYSVLFKNKFIKNKIQPNRSNRKSDLTREFFHSNSSIIISVLLIAPVLLTPLSQYTKYSFSFTTLKNINAWWSPLILLLLFILHDTYFYWTHWLIHKPKFFRHFHIVHHKSYNPTALSAFSFNYTEALCQMFFGVIILFTIPLNRSLVLIFGICEILMNAYGHLGYEIAPLWFRRTFLFKIMVTSTHHNIHHSKSNYNYGLYFRFWDRLMKTEYPQYVEYYDEIQQRRLS
jgi:sterol desaturase/sphingolipid hydroxylase (fatty acid hydroxylase superfamily)